MFYEKGYPEYRLKELCSKITDGTHKTPNYAAEAIEPSADEMIDEVYSSLQQYYKLLSEAYITFIEAILQKETAEKETVSSQLSEDEHLLQIDNDWFAEFCDKLQDIERS